MKVKHINNKKLSVNKNNKHDSTTKVNFSDVAANRYFSNRREVCAFRCDKGLWEHAKPILKRVYGSICRGIEVYLANFIEATERGVYFSNTEKPINIGRIVIERNLRPRRKLEVDVRRANFYDGELGVWCFEEGPLNERGHVVGCGCSVCSRSHVT